MNSERDHQLESLRPILPEKILQTDLTQVERFQNSTLRPIIKLQHPLILLVFKNFIAKTDRSFLKNSAEKRKEFIQVSLNKNQRLRTIYCGMILGMMKHTEAHEYYQIPAEYNKRILQMITERILTNLRELE
jgi:hypothetical protein